MNEGYISVNELGFVWTRTLVRIYVDERPRGCMIILSASDGMEYLVTPAIPGVYLVDSIYPRPPAGTDPAMLDSSGILVVTDVSVIDDFGDLVPICRLECWNKGFNQ